MTDNDPSRFAAYSSCTLDADSRRWAYDVLGSGRLSPVEKLVCAAVLLTYDPADDRSPKTRDIAGRCGVSVEQAQAVLNRLERRGIVGRSDGYLLPKEERPWFPWVPDYSSDDEWLMGWS